MPNAFGVATLQAPIATDLVVAAEFFARRRIVPRFGPVAHLGDISRRKELKLSVPHIQLSRTESPSSPPVSQSIMPI